jgi:hypothetical protein
MYVYIYIYMVYTYVVFQRMVDACIWYVSICRAYELTML